MSEDSSEAVRALVDAALARHPRTVGDLLALCRAKNTGVTERDVLAAVNGLVESNRIVLREPTFRSFGEFFWSAHWNASLFGVLLVSLFSGLLFPVAAMYPWILAQIILGVLLVFYLPGHSLLRIILGVPGDNRVERIVLEIAASIVSIMLLGLLLNFSGLGLFSTSSLSSVIVLNILLAIGASYRDYSGQYRP